MIKQLTPPPSLMVGKKAMSFTGVALGTVMNRTSWRLEPLRVQAWLELDRLFRMDGTGPWPVEEWILTLLADEFRLSEKDLETANPDEYRYLMVCLHSVNISLLRDPPPAPPPEPEAAPSPVKKSRSKKSAPAASA